MVEVVPLSFHDSDIAIIVGAVSAAGYDMVFASVVKTLFSLSQLASFLKELQTAVNVMFCITAHSDTGTP